MLAPAASTSVLAGAHIIVIALASAFSETLESALVVLPRMLAVIY